MKESVAIVFLGNLSKAQGSTEAYYVSRGLAEDYEVDIYTSTDPDIEDATHRSVPGANIVPSLFLYNLLLLPYFMYQFWKRDYDVIYTYKSVLLPPLVTSWIIESVWIVDLQTKPTGQAKEFSENNYITAIYYYSYDVLYRYCLPHASAVITLSKPIRDHIVSEYNVEKSQTHIIPLGVDTTKFVCEGSQGQSTTELDIVYIGSLSRLRGIDTCIEAIAKSESNEEVHLHIYGNGPQDYLDEFKSKIRNNDLTDSITLHGYVDHERLPQHLSKMDAAVSPLPRLDSYEVSSPAKIYEYLAMELPIVCTDIRAHRVVLEEDCTGFFYEPGDPENLVAVINRLRSSSPEKWDQIRSEARETAIENDWSRRVEHVKGIIDTS
jgi:glycosyltransferase involved in cell wall biosynthesis